MTAMPWIPHYCYHCVSPHIKIYDLLEDLKDILEIKMGTQMYPSFISVLPFYKLPDENQILLEVTSSINASI